MPFRGTNATGGKKGRSGRKTKAEEISVIKKKIEENITQEILIKLANSKVYSILAGTEKYSEIKELGLPITLKGITDKIDHTTKGKSIGIIYLPQKNGLETPGQTSDSISKK